VFLFSISENTEFILRQGNIIELYEVEFKEDIPAEELERILEA
jgi:hypothetical protein